MTLYVRRHMGCCGITYVQDTERGSEGVEFCGLIAAVWAKKHIRVCPALCEADDIELPEDERQA